MLIVFLFFVFHLFLAPSFYSVVFLVSLHYVVEIIFADGIRTQGSFDEIGFAT